MSFYNYETQVITPLRRIAAFEETFLMLCIRSPGLKCGPIHRLSSLKLLRIVFIHATQNIGIKSATVLSYFLQLATQ
jgi:hypothetical protein